jgi:hypothetical protein
MTGEEITMDARFDYHGNAVAAKFAKYINSARAVVTQSTRPAAIQELVKIRASQINGCAACTDVALADNLIRPGERHGARVRRCPTASVELALWQTRQALRHDDRPCCRDWLTWA